MGLLRRLPLALTTVFGGGISYLFRDMFITDRAAGGVNGTAAEPGPGTRVVTDTENKVTISGGELVFSGGKASPAFGDPFARNSNGCLRANKSAVYFRFKMSSAAGNVMAIGLKSNTTPGQPDTGIVYSYGSWLLYPGAYLVSQSKILPEIEYELCLVLLTVGVLALIRGGIYYDWTVLGSALSGNTATMYPAFDGFSKPFSVNDVAEVRGASWQLTGTGLATSYVASPSDGQIVTMDSNAVIEFTWTPDTGEVLNLMFRRVDDDNCWKLVGNQAAGSVRLFSRVTGTDTEYVLGFEATTLNVGTAYRIRIECSDFRIKTSVGSAPKQNTYFNDLFVGATGVKVTGFATGANLICWPMLASMPANRSYDYNPSWYLPYGDSKTYGEGYIVNLTTSLVAATGSNWAHYDPVARSGASVASMKAKIDADLAALSAKKNPAYILFNLGSNDATSIPLEAAWKADALYILDAMSAKWPGVQIFLMQPWRRGYNTECDTLAGWIADIVALRSFAHLGGDERVFLENGDNGVTYTGDGIHPNAAGYVLTAAAWKTAMGF